MAKRQVRKKHPVDTDGLVDGAVTITKLDLSIQPGGTLPRDAKLVGIFGTGAGSSGNPGTWSALTGVFFGGHVLPVRPIPHVILPDDTPTASCPGSAAAPDAASGHLCLYLTSFSSSSGLAIYDNSSDENGADYDIGSRMLTPTNDGRVSAFGFTLRVSQQTAVAAQVDGVWAVRS